MPLVARRLFVVLALAGIGLVPAPADAAGYCSGSGVNVVVDFGVLGGGIQKGCDPSGNRNAALAFKNAGHTLTPVQSQPAFVCRVDGLPDNRTEACVVTPPADAYWGLYWSDGRSGWTYSSLAAGSLTVPAGATVAFSWQNGGPADPPGTAPAPPAAAAQPSTSASSPTRAPTTSRPKVTAHASSAAPTARSATPSAGSSVSASPSGAATGASTASTSAAPTASASDSPTASASSSPSSAAAAGPARTRLESADDSGGGLPWWLPLGSIVALAGVGGVVWQVRRARP